MPPRQGRLLVFDSGIGGLSVVQALRQTLPHAHIDYLADTALFPYGEQPDDLLAAHVTATLERVCARVPYDVVVIACNTASTLALAALRARIAVPFVGCVPPIRWAARVSITRTIGLLATTATVRRPYVATLRARYAPDCNVIMHGARDLADLAERAFLGDPVDPVLVERELAALLNQPGGERIDTIGLGCTHYSSLLPALEQAAARLQRAFYWLDTAPAVARHVASVMQAMQATSCPDDTAERFTLTAPSPRATDFAIAMARAGYRAPAMMQMA